MRGSRSVFRFEDCQQTDASWGASLPFRLVAQMHLVSDSVNLEQQKASLRELLDAELKWDNAGERQRQRNAWVQLQADWFGSALASGTCLSCYCDTC